MLNRLERILRLAGQHYIWSWTVWLISGFFLITGLLVTDLTWPWTTPGVVGVLVSGVAGHLTIGAVLTVSRRFARPAVLAARGGGWWVLATLVVAGGARGITIGLVQEATGVGEVAQMLRLLTSAALVGFSFAFVAFSLQLWSDYRQKRRELLVSLLVWEATQHKQELLATGWGGEKTAELSGDVEASRKHALTSLASIRDAVVSGHFSPDSTEDMLSSTDTVWRDTSHREWERGKPQIPRVTATELLRTWSSSKPFSLVVVAVGPLYGVARTLATVTPADRWIFFAVWLLTAVVVAAGANFVASRARLFGPWVLFLGWLGLQAIPVWWAHTVGPDSAWLLQLWFVAFVSSLAALVLGLPPALERQGRSVLGELEKWVDGSTLAAIRRQGEDFVASQRLAHYLHSEIRGHFLRLSISLRSAIDVGDRTEALRVLDDLQVLVTELKPEGTSVSPHANLLEFLDNWARMIQLSHNLETVDLPPEVAIAVETIVMEAVNDAVRHANATRVDVVITEDGDDYHLVITSNGEAPQSAFSGGLGTRNLTTYSPGRWSREVSDTGRQCLRVALSAVPRP